MILFFNREFRLHYLLDKKFSKVDSESFHKNTIKVKITSSETYVKIFRACYI